MADSKDDLVEQARLGSSDFPRAIPEDCVEYFLYLIDPNLTEFQRRDKLRDIQKASTVLIKKYLKDYIWEREAFSLNLARQDGKSYLKGRTSYGDSVDDEWLVVFLLCELSKQFEDVWVRVVDSDGEFLLIEAANALPKWVNPEIADYRVWINKGHLHIIPKLKEEEEDKDFQYSGSLTLTKAVDFLIKNQSKLLSDLSIENEAFYRIKKYPLGIKENFHHAIILIPRKLSYILNKNPSYISPAVEAFYLRDPIALKPLKTTDKTTLVFPPEDLVKCRIRFTKVGFAKVRSQQFPPPQIWSITVSANTKDPKESFRAEMGMKLTSGFEMLLSDPQNKDNKVVREMDILLADLDSGEDQLPTNAEIESWGVAEDDDSWLDINYQEFENELAGRGVKGNISKGFGDTETQEKLRKMVSRFEDLLADDDAGPDGIDEMDEDNDTDQDGVESHVSDEEDQKAEEEFTEMIREMLGMSKEVMEEIKNTATTNITTSRKGKEPAIPKDDSEDEEEEEIRKLTEAMEAELKAAGALNLDSSSGSSKQISSRKTTGEESPDSDDDGILDEDYNLAKNMLAAFKSQAGTSGPASNIMGMMGINFPRDESSDDDDDDDDDDDNDHKRS
jgi:hypothetical protein